jgi:hypothetical protein
VEGATPAALAAWSKALALPLVPVDGADIFQAVRAKDVPLLSGVSNEDTCGIETYSYAPASARNYTIGNTFIEPTPRMESLLLTPTKSALRELMVYGGRSEALRAHTLSRFLHTEKREPQTVLGRVQVGDGAVVFNQFSPAEGERLRFDRLGNRLRASLGQRWTESLLAGDAIPAAQAASRGHPELVYALNQPASPELTQELLERCRPSLERMVAMPVLNVGDWHELTSETGVWSAQGFDLSLPVYLYHTIWSPTPRKNLATNLDVPNPEALTFVDLEGSGRVEFIVNGHAYGPIELTEEEATISDISLEMGGNHILIRWEPERCDAHLSMRWRNIMRQPEVGLLFGGRGSSD